MMLGPILAFALALTLPPAPPVQDTSMTRHARGTFEVSITPVPSAEGAAPDGPGRMTLTKTFHGDIDATGEGEMLATLGPDQSGAYAALERVRGAVNGRTGTFALVHRGVMDRGAQDLSITVVPGSGTGDLTGIAGVFHLTIADGEHRYDLEYTLPSE
jgi:hypothetical protein